MVPLETGGEMDGCGVFPAARRGGWVVGFSEQGEPEGEMAQWNGAYPRAHFQVGLYPLGFSPFLNFIDALAPHIELELV